MPSGNIMWATLDRLHGPWLAVAHRFGDRCQAPRHVGRGIPSAYAVCFVEDGQEDEPVLLAMCTECAGDIARDLGFESAAAGADPGVG